MATEDLPVQSFKTAKAWETWLERHHATSEGVWIQFAKKDSGIASAAYPESVEVALCFGWIDGLRRAHDAEYFLQRFTPRRPRSQWSKLNRERAERLIAAGRMREAGLRQVDAARADGRWEAAYAGPREIEVPDDLLRALEQDRRAKASFAVLSSRNRYAILYRVGEAKRPETRARRIAQFVEMLARGETLYP